MRGIRSIPQLPGGLEGDPRANRRIVEERDEGLVCQEPCPAAGDALAFHPCGQLQSCLQFGHWPILGALESRPNRPTHTPSSRLTSGQTKCLHGHPRSVNAARPKIGSDSPRRHSPPEKAAPVQASHSMVTGVEPVALRRAVPFEHRTSSVYDSASRTRGCPRLSRMVRICCSSPEFGSILTYVPRRKSRSSMASFNRAET